jgi:hypothetical protein
MMWAALVTAFSGFIGLIADAVLPVHSQPTFQAVGVLTAAPFVNGLAILGLFVDLPFMFACIGVVLAWKLIFLVYRIWRLVLEAIPMMG